MTEEVIETAPIEEERQSMAEQAINVIPKENVTPQSSEISAIEQEARNMGWTPKEEFSGDPEIWVDAKEYVARKPLYNQLRNARREAKDNKETMKKFVELIQKQSEMSIDRDKQKIEQERVQAIESGDVNAVKSFDQQMQQLEDQKKAYNELLNQSSSEQISYDSAPQSQSSVDPAAYNFAERNRSWFVRGDGLGAPMTPLNVAMTSYAQQIEGQLSQNHPEWTYPQVLSEVERNVKATFPDNFGGQKVNKTTVETNIGARPMNFKSKEAGLADLSQKEQQVIREMARAAGVKKEDMEKWTKRYIDGLKKTGYPFQPKED